MRSAFGGLLGHYGAPARPPSQIVHRLWQGGTPVSATWVRRTGITMVLDVTDLDDADRLPAAAVLNGKVRKVMRAYRGGHKILVHCQMGLNRSGLVNALALRQLFNLTGAEAMRAVRARRAGSLSNRVFAAHLRRLGRPRPAQARQAVPR